MVCSTYSEIFSINKITRIPTVVVYFVKSRIKGVAIKYCKNFSMYWMETLEKWAKFCKEEVLSEHGSLKSQQMPGKVFFKSMGLKKFTTLRVNN